MKRIGFLIFLILSLFITFGFSYSSDEINTITVPRPEQNISTNDDVNLSYGEQYNFAYDFLKNNGFEYTPERINKSLNANLEDNIEKVLGFSLTDSEKEILIKRDRLIENIPNIEKDFISLVGSNNYAGKYYDQAKGKLYLATTDNNKSHHTFSEKYEDVVVIKAKHSLTELEHQYTKLMEELGSFSKNDSTTASIDHQKNLIVVNTNNPNKVKDIIANLGIEYFEVNHVPSETLITPYLDLNLGVRINDRSTGGSCSSGFLAVNSASQKVAVTAGHCSPYNHANDWTTRGSIFYQTFGTWSSKVVGTNVDADAGTITVNNDVDTFAVIKGSGHADIPITSVQIGTETQGLTLYKQGYRTNRTSGTFHAFAGLSNYPDPQMGNLTIAGLISNMEANNGDSGGTIYRLKADGTAELVGILGGEVIGSTGESYIFYSRITNVYESLGLQGIYLSR